MKKYRFYKKCILIGDKTKYKFLKMLIKNILNIEYTIDQLEQYNICALYSKKAYVEVYSEEKQLEIGVPTIVVGELIYISKNTYDHAEYDIENYIKLDNVIEKLLIVTAFPYNKKGLLDNLGYLRKEIKIGEVKVVLYKENRKFGYTDLQNEKEAIEVAKKEFRKKGIESILVEENQELEYSKRFFSNLDLESSLKEVYKHNFQSVKNEFNTNFDRTYDIFVKGNFVDNCTAIDQKQLEMYNKIFEYNYLKKSKTIWRNYMDEFERKYLFSDNGIFSECLYIQDELIGEISFWNKEEAEYELKKAVTISYQENLSCNLELRVPCDETQYLLMKNKGSISLESKFDEKIKLFVENELKEVVRGFIIEKLNMLNLEGEEGI